MTHFARQKFHEWQEILIIVYCYMFQSHVEDFLPGPTVELDRGMKYLLHVRHAGGVPAADVTVE